MHKLLNRKILIPLLLICMIGIFIAAAAVHISSPGIQYDEALFINAAVNGDRTTFIVKRVFDIPFLLMPYIGALKAYIYTPIFAAFGVSALTIRLPMILLTALSLYLFFRLIKKNINIKFGLIAVGILIIDSSLISMVRADIGPVAIELFLKTASLLVLAKFAEKQKKRYLMLLILLILLGVFNKLNFIWFVNSLGLGIVIIYWKEILSFIKKISWVKRIVYLILAVFSFTLPYLYYLYISNKFSLGSEVALSNISLHFNYAITSLVDIVSGRAFYNYVLGEFPFTPLSDIYTYFLLFIIVSGIIISFVKRKSIPTSHIKYFYFTLILIISDFLQILLTKSATAPWHFFTVYPYLAILITYSLYFITFIKIKKIPYFSKMILIFLLISVISYQGLVYSLYIQKYSSDIKSPTHSTKIYDLIEYTKASNKKFAILDWGMYTQLLGFTKSKDKYYEIFWSMISPLSETDRKAFIEKYVDNNYLFITHSEKGSVFSMVRKNFMEIINKEGLKYNIIKQFNDQYGTVYEIFEIYK